MVNEQEKTTVPIPSVGADGEQPILNNTTGIISTDPPEINSQFSEPEENFEDIQRQLDRMMNPAYLHTVTLNELYETTYPSRPPIIDGLLYPGTYLFAGAPKVGKSFLVAQIAYHISMGLPLWDYPVNQCTALYLALEDDYRRLQERMFRMFGVDSTENLHFATAAKQIGKGLEDQMELFLREHPNTRLIIIDTMQKVRELGGEGNLYASDYDIIGKMKQFADKHGICLLLVHHTRKQPAADKFDMISGSTGLLGCADGAFLLQKDQRTGITATLEVTGRDQPAQRIFLNHNPERLYWDLDHVETNLHKIPPDPILEKIDAMLTDSWNGTATELVQLLAVDYKPNAITRYLNVNNGRLENEYGITYQNRRTHSGRIVILNRIQSSP